MAKGRLVVVGTGLITPAHLSLEAKSYIESCEVMHYLMTDALAEPFLKELSSKNKNSICKDLGDFYFKGKNRLESYNMMVDEILADVRAGKSVCAVFYGHPGVFVYPSHKSITIAKSEGHEAKMLPAISAEDCLVADLGMDPGTLGCQNYEATQLLFYQHQVNVCAPLILWQVGVVGDVTMSTELVPAKKGVDMLKDKLFNWYPQTHEVILYEAATLPLMPPRIDVKTIAGLKEEDINIITTLIIPALSKPALDDSFCKKWGVQIN
ncbi:MAG: SAM-dependent methyltransferase [Gammaproteobacteria bacterium]|nr:SAM-dependent methyltransferase [Gammaproteobacteria bacterium]